MEQRTHPLLRTILPDGTIYLFVIEADDTWTIRRDDHIIASGVGDNRGIGRGTRLFCSLTRTQPRISPFPSAPSIAPPAPTELPPPPPNAES